MNNKNIVPSSGRTIPSGMKCGGIILDMASLVRIPTIPSGMTYGIIPGMIKRRIPSGMTYGIIPDIIKRRIPSGMICGFHGFQ